VFEEHDLTSHNDAKRVVRMVIDACRSITNRPVEIEADRDLVNTVVAAERWIQGKDEAQSQKDPKFRTHGYSEGFQRLRLHADIIERLLTKVRPANDDAITFETGGACPDGGVKRGLMAYLLTGPPASGKSTLARRIFSREGALLVDPDDAKRMLPEYEGGRNAHSLHEESSRITKGQDGLLTCAILRRYNFVLPMTGADGRALLATADSLSRYGYKTVLVAVDCPAEVAAYRSLKRTKSEGRYVPLSFILSKVGARPKQAFEAVRRSPQWSGYAMCDTWSNDREATITVRSGNVPNLDP